MPSLTMFTWGYWGWGNATRQFVKSVDAVEAMRGFAPPLFVDIRFSRSVRAEGFKGGAFAAATGAERYIHMQRLGNENIDKKGVRLVKIHDPAAVPDLLYLAQARAKRHQRVIFFCQCKHPLMAGGRCHRFTVTGLLLKEARRQRIPLEIIEWPGGSPQVVDLALPAAEVRKLKQGAKSVPFGRLLSPEEAASLPWGSTAKVHSGDTKISLKVGPARFEGRKWHLPVLGDA